MRRVAIFLIMVALIAGMVGCEPAPIPQYDLTITSTVGGNVTTPGEGTFTYDEVTVVNLAAEAEEGYFFVNWTGDVATIGNVNTAITIITTNDNYEITANFALEILEIRDWYDLHALRENLGRNYLLMNDLDSTTAGYAELASPTTNEGKAWEPIGTSDDQFAGTFHGQGYQVRDLFINRADENGVGLFGIVGEAGAIENTGAVNIVVTGNRYVGGLVGQNEGILTGCYSTGSVTGEGGAGGLVGQNGGGVRDSYSTSSVTGGWSVGGLVGWNYRGTVSNSYSTGEVTGEREFGGIVGSNFEGTVSNSYYSYDETLINGEKLITIGALFAQDFEQWLANDKSLDVNERLSEKEGYYLINDVNDFKSLLAFGQDGALKFRLTNDLDLGHELNFYIPYLAGEFDGNGHKIRNLSFDLFLSQVGLFGYLASGGKINEVGAENVNIAGRQGLGALVGWNEGIVSDAYSTGSIIAYYGTVGGLVGHNDGTVSKSYSTCSVTGYDWVGGLVGENCDAVSDSYSTGSVTGSTYVGGLVGWNLWDGTVSNSHYSYDEVLINWENVITIGALSNEDFEQWLANGKFLDVDGRLSQEDGCYLINNVNDFKQLLAFGQNDGLRFRLTDDLDLGGDPNFYIPYLAGEFDGNGHKIRNLSFSFDFAADVGLFGYLPSHGQVSEVGAENVNITGNDCVGGLVGYSQNGTVDRSYSTGSVTCDVTDSGRVGGLVGWNEGTVNNSYSTASVTGGSCVGGLLGANGWVGSVATVSNSYSTGSVTGSGRVGGLVGYSRGTVDDSFWDMQSSGQTTSDGGIGKTTAEMKSITTFSGAGWNIITVANPSTRNPSYIWNIVDGQTYPFLSWEPYTWQESPSF